MQGSQALGGLLQAREASGRGRVEGEQHAERRARELLLTQSFVRGPRKNFSGGDVEGRGSGSLSFSLFYVT